MGYLKVINSHYFSLNQEAQRASSGQVMLKSMSKWMSRLFILTGFNSDVNAYLKLAKRSTQSILDECTSNKDLQAVLCSNLGDYGKIECFCMIFSLESFTLIYLFFKC